MPEEEYTYELGVCEMTGDAVLDMDEMARFIAEKTGTTVEQIVAYQEAELEYMTKCGIVAQEV
ncbi:hypothetical protein C0431_13140 [bacterium]|nr:hypothetical protein [bacterium]